ncbi:MAG: tetratricopeptide repeat protein [Pirellulales bacterium]
MASYSRLRRRQLLQEAEGYLELLLTFADKWPLSPQQRDRVALRALQALDRLDDPNCLAALLLRGQGLRVMEQYDAAVIAFQQSLEKDPENVAAFLELGWCYKRLGRLDLAIQSLEDALEVDRSQGIIHYNLACYWSLAHNVGLTLVHLAQAFELDECFRDLVASEPDFDSVRNHPEFQQLTSVIV